jgi:hypothetical protein
MTDHIDNEIARLTSEIEALRAEKAAFTGPTKPFIVGMDENNSGGYYWLGEDDYKDLIDKGWTRGVEKYGYGGTETRVAHKTFEAASEDHAIELAKSEFEVVTGQRADAIGCTCCGRPFYFSVDPYWIIDEEDK